jgi:hypothetical protein
MAFSVTPLFDSNQAVWVIWAFYVWMDIFRNTPESKVRRKWRKVVLCFTWTWSLQYFLILFYNVFFLWKIICVIDWCSKVSWFLCILYTCTEMLYVAVVCAFVIWYQGLGCMFLKSVFKIILYCFTDFVEVTSESSTKSSWAFHIFSHINSG